MISFRLRTIYPKEEDKEALISDMRALSATNEDRRDTGNRSATSQVIMFRRIHVPKMY